MAEAIDNQEVNIFSAFEETNEFLKIEFDIANRQQKMLINNPQAFLAKKMRDSEVVIAKLPPQERQLFVRTKTKKGGFLVVKRGSQEVLVQARGQGGV